MRPSATILVTLTLLCAPAAARGQDAGVVTPTAMALETRAQALYQQGREHFHAGRFDEARGAFQASLDMVDSPNARMYLGRSLSRLGRVAEAYTALDRAARDAGVRARTEPRYQATSDSARAEAEALRPLVAWLVLRVDPMPDDLAVLVGELPVQRGGIGVEIPLSPGEVVVTARARGFRAAEARASLVAGETARVALAMEPEPVATDASTASVEDASTPADVPALVYSRRGPLRTAGLVTGITGVVTLATGLVFGIIAWDQFQTFSGDTSQGSVADDGIRNRDTANALFAVGGALSAAGLLMWLVAPARAEAPAALRVSLTPTAGGVGLAGTF